MSCIWLAGCSMSYQWLLRSLAVGSMGLCLASMTIGCANATLTVSQPILVHPKQVAVIINDNTPDKMAPGDRDSLNATICGALQNEGIAARSSDSESLPRLVGSITQYDPGSQALRFFIAFGAGAGSFESSWKLLDQDGTTLGSCTIEGGVSFGVTGGDFGEVIEKVGERLTEFLNGTK